MITNAIWSCSVKSKIKLTELDKFNLGRSTGLITRLESLELSPIMVDSSPILWVQKRILVDLGAKFMILVAYDYKKLQRQIF